jgi:hypothetical protein
MSDSDLNEAIALYKETRPKLVISHTAPSEGVKEILKGLNGSYFMNKHGDVESRTVRALQEMFEAHQPSVWHFGHFHINREFLIGSVAWRRWPDSRSCRAIRVAYGYFLALHENAPANASEAM